MLIIYGIRSVSRFVLTLLFLFFLSKRHPILYGVCMVCRFLVVFVACEPFLLSGGVLNRLVNENGCGGLKNASRSGLGVRLLTVEVLPNVFG